MSKGSKQRQPSKGGLSIIKPLNTQPAKISREIEYYEKIDYPLFSFRYLQKVSFDNCKEGKFFISFLERLHKLSLLGWNEINQSQRHAFGMEKLPQNIIKPSLPSIITPEVQLFALRATGNNLPFVGFREGKIFHIVFIETSFGDIYSH